MNRLRVVTMQVTNPGDGEVASASVRIPGGLEVIDVIVRNPVAFDSATSATLTVGDETDPDGLVASADLTTENPSPTLGALFTSAAFAGGLSRPGPRTLVASAAAVGAGTAGVARVHVLLAPSSIR